MSVPPIVWTIAGSDSGGGAGLQADLRAFDAFDVHGCSAVAALTAQHSRAVERIEAVSPQMLQDQLAALAADLPPRAVKTGMLGSAVNVEVVARWIDALRAAHPLSGIALVVDPVLGASTGAAFADDAVLRAMREQLLPRATLATPNRQEAARLLGLPALAGAAAVEEAARALQALGCRAITVTGGDAATSAQAPASEDYLLAPQAQGWLALPRLETPHHHGSGCTYASAAAAALAHGFVEAEAAVLAKMATHHALRHGYAAGGGAGPVRARAGFAQEIGNLPSLNPPHTPCSFAPLAQPDMGLYAIVDNAGWVYRVLEAGIRTVQLRIKDAGTHELRHEIRRAVAAAQAAGAQLFVNDHWQLALEEGAWGVHLGQEDLQTADLPRIAAAGLRLGVSTHSYWEVCRAWALRPSYIACGPIHTTQSKAMPWIAQGEGNLAYWCRLLPLPVVAIGGMDVARARAARLCGAAGVAVMSGITAAADWRRAVHDYAQAAQAAPAAQAPGLPWIRPTLPRT